MNSAMKLDRPRGFEKTDAPELIAEKNKAAFARAGGIWAKGPRPLWTFLGIPSYIDRVIADRGPGAEWHREQIAMLWHVKRVITHITNCSQTADANVHAAQLAEAMKAREALATALDVVDALIFDAEIKLGFEISLADVKPLSATEASPTNEPDSVSSGKTAENVNPASVAATE